MQLARPYSAGTLPAVARACPELAEGRLALASGGQHWREACHENVNHISEEYMSLWGS